MNFNWFVGKEFSLHFAKLFSINHHFTLRDAHEIIHEFMDCAAWCKDFE